MTAISRVQSPPEEAPSLIVQYATGERERLFFPISKVHNEFLDYALTFGVPAALLFFLIIFTGVSRNMADVLGLSATLISYGVYLTTWPEIVRFAPLAWFILGVALVKAGPRVDRQTRIPT
ncbi:hypothetical protein [Deinococcus multiflagellatus]|uniref:Uncharacterized protein n=1 Tax=Deinococcus multiflagellatus TaxID=1656887 RepID=A0ABW1ZM93_9DEIO